MEELKEIIGLTTDEIMIIIYTSLDHDYLTNMLVLAGEFLKWFNLNFEGESRDEIDFLENKQEIWAATCSLAADVVEAQEKIEDLSVILTAEWWSRLRFAKLGA